MSFGRSYQPQGGTAYECRWAMMPGNHENNYYYPQNDYYNKYDRYSHYGSGTFDNMKAHDYHYNASRNCRVRSYGGSYSKPNASQSFKRRKVSENSWGSDVGFYWRPNEYDCTLSNPSATNVSVSTTTVSSTSAQYNTGKRDRSDLENDEEVVLLSKAEIERCSPSRKDGIDASHETRLRYSYSAFIQQLGMSLDLPQTTMGTAMVLCHRFFLRRSHASNDRFLIATAALFLAAKSEETPRPLNDVLKASCEIIHKQDLTFLSYMLPVDWFEQHRERITVAEQLILETLNFELTVRHPYDPLTSILDKLGLSQTLMVDLALNLVNEGACTRLDAHLMIFLAGGLIAVMKLCFTSEVYPRCVVDCLTLTVSVKLIFGYSRIGIDSLGTSLLAVQLPC